MRDVIRTLAVVVAALLCGSHARAEEPPKSGMTEDECRAVWNTAAGRADLYVDGAKPYIDDFEAVDTNRDRKISNTEFRTACAAGLVHKFRKPE